MRIDIFFKIGFNLKSNDFDFEIVNFPFLDGDVPRSPSYGVYISQLIRFARVCSNIDDFNNRTLFMTAKLLKQDIIKFEKAFSKLYHRHSELMVKYNIGLKTLLQQGISEPIFYGDLVYNYSKKLLATLILVINSKRLSNVIKKKVGYNLDIMRQSACLVVNPITGFSRGFLFNCTTVGQASDSMTSLT